MLLALALLFAQSDAPAEAVLRTLDVAIVTEDGDRVEGLVPEEVVVLENGVARDVSRVERDTRPLHVTLLVDSSQEIQTAYRQQLLPAVEAFLDELDPETRLSVWTTGARPTLRYGPGADHEAALRSLQRVIAEGGNTVLDALVETTREVGRPEGERTAVVVLSSETVEFSSRDRRQVVEIARDQAGEFHAVHFQEGQADREMQIAYGYTFSELAEQTGGLHERILSSMSVTSRMRKVGADIASRYRVRYATLDDIGKRKLEVEIARPDVETRVVRRGDDQ